MTSTRRTFAIISHPDAGQTTLPPTLLLPRGPIRPAAPVNGRDSGATSSTTWALPATGLTNSVPMRSAFKALSAEPYAVSATNSRGCRPR